MSTRSFRILSALSGIAGVIMLIPSFIINPGPPPNPTVAQLIAFANQYRTSILIGAWLQAVSPVLIILFALAIVHQAGATRRFVGWMTLLGGGILVMTSLIGVTFYLSGVDGNLATTDKLKLVRLFIHKIIVHMLSPQFFTLTIQWLVTDWQNDQLLCYRNGLPTPHWTSWQYIGSSVPPKS